MSLKVHSLISINDLDKNTVENIFSYTKKNQKVETQKSFKNQHIALLFLEASTRTRMSFEAACARLGFVPSLMDGSVGTSIEKGETIEDTIYNVAAMSPTAIILRVGGEVDMYQIQKNIQPPVINAGWGVVEHPSQALLDAFTVLEKAGTLKGQKWLIVGDIIHSRVASSHIKLASILGYELAFCGPEELLPKGVDLRIFNKLEEGLKWCNVVMPLRAQTERHQSKYNFTDFREKYGLTLLKLKNFSSEGLIMHPGPVNKNVEIDDEVYSETRSVILQQVKNGVFIRQAIISMLTEGW